MHGCRWRTTLPVGCSGARLTCAGRRILLFVLLASSLPAFSTSTDVVLLKGGDRLTGEIKKLNRGKLTFKTDHLGTVDIEWDEILSLESAASYTIELQDGTEIFGSLTVGAPEGMLRIETGQGPVETSMGRILRMTPVKATFWAKLDGSLDLGYNYTSSSRVSQISVDLDVKRRSAFRESQLQASGIVTKNPEAESTQREDVTFSETWFHQRRWFTRGMGQLQRNEELGLDLRSLVGALEGRHVVQNARSRFDLGAGFALTEEVTVGSGSEGAQVEMVLAALCEVFRYDYPEMDITVSLLVYPGMTQWGGLRAEFDASLQHEIFKDFFVDFDYYDSYDNDPGSAAAERRDYGLVFSVGWKF